MTAATSPIGISRLGQIAINVHDVDRATAFYRDTLGLSLLFATGSLAFFDCGGVRLMLSRPEKPEFDHPSSVLYFTVPDILSTHREMLSPHREDAHSRSVDDVFSRHRKESAGSDVRGAAGKIAQP
jgi:catechol 2,3-dioxygenase-like lactoylglutathione lyase family enzyme